jgi:hypothetical protein
METPQSHKKGFAVVSILPQRRKNEKGKRRRRGGKEILFINTHTKKKNTSYTFPQKIYSYLLYHEKSNN